LAAAEGFQPMGLFSWMKRKKNTTEAPAAAPSSPAAPAPAAKPAPAAAGSAAKKPAAKAASSKKK